jgi:catechol 2,3-dioxygenase-like lactoylglutathione lyase family enzyme
VVGLLGRSGRGLSVDLDHIQLSAPPDCEPAARAFFGEILGLREIAKPVALAGRGGVWFELGDARQLHIGVVPGDQFVAAIKAHAGFRLSLGQLVELAQRLVEAEYPVVWAPAEEIPGVRRLHTTDPWGNRLELLADAG